ncbi:MAG: endonuclease III [Nanoarchaeota archaeon]
MKRPKNIEKVIALLKEEVRHFENPVVSKIGEIQKDPFKVLISCILSLRTQDKTTGPIALKLFKEADTPEKIAKMPINKLKKIIKPVNYYITKSKRIKGISKSIIRDYNGKVPDSFDELMKLKGVGRKTANIVMTYGFFKKDYIPIDTHCHRIPNRIGWVKTKTPEQTEFALKEILPKKYWQDFNDIFVLFGQNICRPIGPHCWECPIRKYCKYYKEVYLPSKNK